MTPLVSVVVPTAGRPEAMARAVRSALDQTMADLEVIVVVDGEDVATSLALESIADPRLRPIVQLVRQGARIARDTGISAARGEWIAFLDDDDLWLPTKLERQLAAAPADGALVTTLYQVRGPLCDLVKPSRPYTVAETVDEWLFDRHSWLRAGGAMLQTSALLAPRTLFDRLRFAALGQHEDWELGIRAVKQLGLPLVTVAEPLTVYHLAASGSLSHANRWQGSLAWIESMRELVTPRAFSGFCLTVATQGLSAVDRPRALPALLAAAWRHGQPTARQLFAFALIAGVPHGWRQRLRSRKTRADRDLP